jgi:hypothetical protein
MAHPGDDHVPRLLDIDHYSVHDLPKNRRRYAQARNSFPVRSYFRLLQSKTDQDLSS